MRGTYHAANTRRLKLYRQRLFFGTDKSIKDFYEAIKKDYPYHYSVLYADLRIGYKLHLERYPDLAAISVVGKAIDKSKFEQYLIRELLAA